MGRDHLVNSLYKKTNVHFYLSKLTQSKSDGMHRYRYKVYVYLCILSIKIK